MTVLVDTSAWYALADASDSNHKKAKTYYEQSIEESQFILTDAILVETWSLINARKGWNAAYEFFRKIRESAFDIHYLGELDYENAWRILNDYSELELSLVDCTTLSYMDRSRIQHIFTFDKHFLIYRYGPHKQFALVCHPHVPQ